MYDFVLRISLVVSLAAMIYILARVIARVKDEDLIVNDDSLHRLLKKIPLEKIDNWIHLFTAKFLRRLRVIVLKFDNLLHGYLVRIKKANDVTTGNSSASLLKELNDKGEK